jgi:hypothetical protein
VKLISFLATLALIVGTGIIIAIIMLGNLGAFDYCK